MQNIKLLDSHTALASFTWWNCSTYSNNNKISPKSQDTLSTHRNTTETIRSYSYDHWSKNNQKEDYKDIGDLKERHVRRT